MRPDRPSKVSRLTADFQPSCAWVRARVFDYLDGELESANGRALEAHVQTCAACRREVESCRRSETALASALRSVPPVEDMRAEFYMRLAAAPPSRRRPLLRIAVPTFAIAALLLFTWMRFMPGTPARTASSHGGASNIARSVPQTVPVAPLEGSRVALPGKKRNNEIVASAADVSSHSTARNLRRRARTIVQGPLGTKRSLRIAYAPRLRHAASLFAANGFAKVRRRRARTELPKLVADNSRTESLWEKEAAPASLFRDSPLSPESVSLANLSKKNTPPVTVASLQDQSDQDEVDLRVQDEARGFTTTTRVTGRVREANGEQVLTIDADGTPPEEP